ncbi:33 kDa chaperonin [Candidatus Defluviicoccus seviourii]|uniref:33 kDa chaperonin n=2 Tax=root TaxID=1 RepID=A0A564WD79_9PROT|nr:33 kDa chaperonin [uncultured Defluviicoccus sp.]VUX46450.1 33 kDa chaperonin [Candidatus Defluviicoccus seviourii]
MDLSPNAADFVQPFQIEGLGLRGRLVRLGPVVRSVVAHHGYPPAVTALMAETLALAAVLASALKYDGVFTLQLRGDGPLSLVVVDITSAGDMRGYARCDEAAIGDALPAGAVSVPRLMGAGTMVFTVDQGPRTERYQGVTALEGASLSECAHAYFRQSEQVQTAIILVAAPEPDTAGDETAAGIRAAALMIQRLAGSDDGDATADENWHRAVVLMSSVRADELLSSMLSPAEVLFRLFHEDGVRLFRQRPLRAGCRCSQTKVERLIATFSPAEITTMADNGRIAVTCEFCKTVYDVTVGTA